MCYMQKVYEKKSSNTLQCLVPHRALDDKACACDLEVKVTDFDIFIRKFCVHLGRQSSRHVSFREGLVCWLFWV